jgi:hypothetical protein
MSVSARGQATLSGFRVVVDPQTTFSERSIKIGDDLTFDAIGQSLAIRSCSVAMQSSHALDATLSGTIQNISTSRDFENVNLDVSYNLAKLLDMIQPMLSPQTRQTLDPYKITGVQKHTIQITGSFPSGQSFQQSIKQLSIAGSIGLDSFKGNGLTIAHLSPAFTLRDGVLTIKDMRGTMLNGGTIDLSGISYDLSDPAERVWAPANLQLVRGASLNALMLGKFGSKITPLLSDPKDAAGVLDLMLVQCNGLSLAQFGGPVAAGSSGSATVVFSIHNMHLANDMSAAIFIFAPRTVLQQQLIGNIDDGQFSIDNGVVSSNVTLFIGKNTSMGFHGNVDLATQDLDGFVLDFPTPMLADLINNPRINRLLPTQIPIAIKGTTRHYTLAWQDSLDHSVQDVLNKTGGGLVNGVKGVLGKVGGAIQKGTDQLQQSDQNDQSQQDHQDKGVKGFFKNLFGK